MRIKYLIVVFCIIAMRLSQSIPMRAYQNVPLSITTQTGGVHIAWQGSVDQFASTTLAAAPSE